MSTFVYGKGRAQENDERQLTDNEREENERRRAGQWLVRTGLSGLVVWSLLFLLLAGLDWISLATAWTIILGAGLFILGPITLMGLCLVWTTQNGTKLNRDRES